MNLFQGLKAKVKTKIPLSRYTTFKIGGEADFFIEPTDVRELRKILKIAKRNNLRIYILGAGSNLLVSDEGVRAVVIRLSSDYFKKIKFLGNYVWVGAGLKVSRLLKSCLENGLGGIEFLTGIPATLGGAIFMNAGTNEGCIGDFVEEVKVMDYNGKIKKLKRNSLDFGYRCSNLRNFIIIEALLRLIKKDKKEIRDKMDYFMNYRRLTQELSYPSCGCIFKNPNGFFAGKLIEDCKLKGKSIGDAQVSQKHANFIINRNSASAKDVLKLIDYIKGKVKKKFNIDLELEIEIW